MSDGYTKLFATITDSTIWAAPDTTRLVWITMLAMADQHGYVGASVPGLAARARVPIEDCIKALETFLSPDKWSRTPDYEGRRITNTDGGWILLNHAKYRAARDKDARREQSRVAMAKLRADRKGVNNVNKVSHGEPQFAQAEAEAEAEAEADTKQSKAIARSAQLSDDFQPTDEHFELANQVGVNLHDEILRFADYHKAKGSKMKDWNAALRTWIRNAATFAKKNTPSQTRADRLKHTGDLLTGRVKNVTNLVD